MKAEQAERLTCEVEALIDRLNAARLVATDEQRIAKIRRCSSAAWRRWHRRVELWVHSEAR
jgi:hypothetical protein